MATIDTFTAQVARTDRREPSEALRIGVMGIFGELGSLISEFKKRAREGESYVSFGQNLIEEAGDLFWYFTAVADTVGLPFHLALSQAIESDIRADTSFVEIDAALVGRELVFDADPWLMAAASAGKIVEASSAPSDLTALHEPLVCALRRVIDAMSSANVPISSALLQNMEKSESRFPSERVHLPLYDDRIQSDGRTVPLDEQLHKRLSVDFEERTISGRKLVTQKVFMIKIGDPLTDNIGEEDFYRFHDAFHLAYAAILGWSPVLRSLFKVKRKSFPQLDENEDGARAVLIEEGISSWVFNTAKPHYFEGATRVDYQTLKTIKEFTRGYEVYDQPMWAWEEAILTGFSVFRQLKAHRRGRVVIDLIDREIRFEELRL